MLKFSENCTSDDDLVVGRRGLNQTCIRQGQAQKLRLRFMDFGLILWTEDDLGLQTGPVTTTQTLFKVSYIIV